MAKREASWEYRDRFDASFARAYWRVFGEKIVSSIGVGTYLGEPTDAVDTQYFDAITTALESGVNVVDTAINYRHQRSERVVGGALAEADVHREAVVVTTKGGFIPFDGERPADPGAYIRSEYLDSGLVGPDSIAKNIHSLAPAFIEDQLDRSLSNLGLDTIDCYYVHNPETQLAVRDRAAVYDQLEAVFERLEKRAEAGDIDHYGVATWQAFRVHPDHEQFLSLPEVVRRARDAAKTVGTGGTHFRAIQLPFNIAMADAFTVDAHEGADGRQSALWFANDAGLDVFTSASLAQGDLARSIPESVTDRLAGDTMAQQALNFARSGPGVTASLVGMASSGHVEENVAAGSFQPMGADAFDATFE